MNGNVRRVWALRMLVAVVMAAVALAGCNGNREAALIGNWKIDASTVSLNATKVMGMDISKLPNANKNSSKPLVFALSADGKQLSVQPQPGQANTGGGAMVFVKQ